MSGEPIEEYLDALYVSLRSDPRSARRLLDEAADHLYGAAAELEASGLSRIEAEREAVRRFGPGDALASADRRRPFGRLLLDTGFACMALGGIGLVAIGISGVLAAAMSVLFGQDFVGGGLAHSIAGGRASVTENAHDALALRALAGLVGLVVLAAVWFARRRGLRLRVLPVSYVDTVGLVAFAGAALLLAAASVVQVVQQHGHGTGFFLSGALVCVPGAAVFGARAARSVLRRPA